MKTLKGKCKNCLGCNLLENENFEGKNRCDNYVKDADDFDKLFTIAFIIYIFTIILLVFSTGLWLYRISIL